MNFAGSCLLAVVLLWAASARSQGTNSAVPRGAKSGGEQDAKSAGADLPYARIVERNMFGLLPIPPPDPNADKPPVDPPPKITLNGIMTIFGKDQALFKVATKPKPGQPQKDDSFVLAEGEMQDDIMVKKINHQDRIVTFDNHGTIQDVALIDSKDTGSGGGGSTPGNAGGIQRPNPVFPRAGGAPGMRAFPGRALGAAVPGAGNNNAMGNPGGSAGLAGLGGGTAGATGISYLGGTPVNANRVYQPVADPEPMTPEQNAYLIEAQRLQALKSGNQHMANLYPPTPMTSEVIQEFQNGDGATQ